MAIKVNGVSVISDSRKAEFRGTNPGRFTTTERDNLSPAVGDLIFNTTDTQLQVWDGSEWTSVGATGPDGALVITKPVITSPVADPLGTATPIQLSSTTFIGSDFVGSDVLLQSVDVTWEVSTDAAFTSPMVDSKAVTSGNQTLQESERTNIVLNNNTNYYIRVKYNGTYDGTAVSSAYSDMVEVRFKPQPSIVLKDNWSSNNWSWRDDTGTQYTVSDLSGQQMTDLWNDQSFQENKSFVVYNNTPTSGRGFFMGFYGQGSNNDAWRWEGENLTDTYFELGLTVWQTASGGNARFVSTWSEFQKDGGTTAVSGTDYLIIEKQFTQSASSPSSLNGIVKVRFYSNITQFKYNTSVTSSAPSSANANMNWWRITDLNGNDLFPQFS